MDLNFLIMAITLGLVGSFHCVGMCGPIAIALPLGRKSWLSRITGGVLYNIGRTITYTLMGAVFGLIGQGLALGGFQRWVSIIMGAIMVLSVLFPALYKNRFDYEKGIFSYVGKLKLRLGHLFRKSSFSSLFIIGLLNGLLPCGLVYMAIAGAIATSHVYEGMLFMFIFGVGTIPMLLAISLIGNMATGKIRHKITKVIPVVVVIIGLLFILRGLNLGIPYVSPPKEKLELEFHQQMQNDNQHMSVEDEMPEPCCH